MDFTYPSLEEPAPPPLPVVHVKPSVVEVTVRSDISNDQDGKVEACGPPAPSRSAATNVSAVIQPASSVKIIPQVSYVWQEIMIVLKYSIVPLTLHTLNWSYMLGEHASSKMSKKKVSFK